MKKHKSKRSVKRNKFFEALKSGFEDIIAYQQGKLHLRSETFEIPESTEEHDKDESIHQIHPKRQSKSSKR